MQKESVCSSEGTPFPMQQETRQREASAGNQVWSIIQIYEHVRM